VVSWGTVDMVDRVQDVHGCFWLVIRGFPGLREIEGIIAQTTKYSWWIVRPLGLFLYALGVRDRIPNACCCCWKSF